MTSAGKLGAIHDLINDVQWTSDKLSSEIQRRSRTVARFCHDSDNRFVIAHANSPSFFADLFAVWSVGGCAVCVNSGLSAMELQTVVDFIQPRAILVGDSAQVESDVPTLCLADEQTASTSVERRSSRIDDPALVLFTSGTSGQPKGVVHTHRSLLSRISLNQAHIGRAVLSKSLCVLPTHFGHGLIGNCLTPLLAGCDIFLMHGGGIAAASNLGTTLDQHGITFMSSVPGVWKMALRVSSPPTRKQIRRVHIGSAPLSADLWKDVIEWSGATEVVNMYGITETANWVAGASSTDFTPEDGLLGTLWGGTAGLLTEDGDVLQEGAGELLLHVPSIMSSYYERSDLTDQVLINGWYRTGDMGTIDENSVLRLTGRNRYAINLDGIKIYPEELDLLFERHPNVAEACAFGIPDEISGQVVAIAICPREGHSLTVAELTGWAQQRVRPEAVPRQVFLVDTIPKTDRGKLNRDVVAKACLSQGSP